MPENNSRGGTDPLSGKTPRDVVLFDRAPTSDETAAIAGSDMTVLFDLLVLGIASWVLPERWWRYLTRGLERMKRLASPRATSENANKIGAVPELARSGRASSRQLALEVAASRSEHHMQVLRDHRPGRWQPELDITGLEHLTAAIDAGRGAVLWVSHFAFNTLATKMALHRAGFKVAHVSRPEHGFSKTAFGIRCLNPLRGGAEARYLDHRILIDAGNPGKAMRSAHRVLSKGGVLTITAGAWAGKRLAEGRMLNGRMQLAVGAPGLAHATGAVLIPVFTVRDRASTVIDVNLGAPLEIDRAGARDDVVLRAVADYLDALEPWVRRYPEQWRGWSRLSAAAPATPGENG